MRKLAGSVDIGCIVGSEDVTALNCNGVWYSFDQYESHLIMSHKQQFRDCRVTP